MTAAGYNPRERERKWRDQTIWAISWSLGLKRFECSIVRDGLSDHEFEAQKDWARNRSAAAYERALQGRSL